MHGSCIREKEENTEEFPDISETPTGIETAKDTPGSPVHGGEKKDMLMMLIIFLEKWRIIMIHYQVGIIKY